MFDLDQYAKDALAAGCPADQNKNLVRAGIVLQYRQLLASAAARLCDQPGGPTMIGFGGARGGGKSHWLMAQIGADDCQRYPGLKVLLLRKSGKANREAFEDLRQRLFPNLKHSYSASTGILIFENGSRIIIKHYQHENEINNSFLGMEYDVIAIEEATTLTIRKWQDIQTCCRTSKPAWRPRIYSTTNPGGVGHEWYRKTFIVPFDRQTETDTRFIPARVEDNKFTNPEYVHILDSQPGWRKPAWRFGDWNIPAGQFFNTFRHNVHVIDHFDDARGVEWFAAMDYGFSHYTVVLLGCRDVEDNLFVVDEFAARFLIPTHINQGAAAMLLCHKVLPPGHQAKPSTRPSRANGYRAWPEFYGHSHLSNFAAGGDLFARQFDGTTIASHFPSLGYIRPANTNRVQGWAEIQSLLGDPDNGVMPRMFIHARCRRLLATLPYLQHDPDHPADVLKANTDEEGLGGDDAADALRYLVATRIPRVYQRKLRGL